MSEKDRIPPPDGLFLQKETAKAFNYTWSDWLAELPHVKADLMAHEIEKSLRSAWQIEKQMGAPTPEENKKSSGEMHWAEYRKSMIGR